MLMLGAVLQEFRQEVAIMKRMKHPNVVRTLSVMYLFASTLCAATVWTEGLEADMPLRSELH